MITAPTTGATLTLADDTNDSLAGLQITVEVEAEDFDVGDEIDLTINGTTIARTLAVPEDGELTFEDVTLPNGAVTLVAETRGGAVRSNQVVLNVVDDCFTVTFVTPTPAPGTVRLGPGDDTDGEACGDSFESEVVVSTAAPNGSEARVFVNGTPRGSARVNEGVVRFPAVGFDLAVQNTLRVEVVGAGGVMCGRDFVSPIAIDCVAVPCQITSPASGRAFLNQSDDVSAAPGFQGDFEVTTDAEGARQPVRLVIDGDESGAITTNADGTVASFGNVALSEGVHRITAVCSDAAGNQSRSTAEYAVDTIACGVTLAQPSAGTLFTDTDDLDPGADGIQVEAGGTAGSECTQIRAGACTGIEGRPYTTAQANWTQRVTLGSSATQQVCAQSVDQAGNVSTASVEVLVRTSAPQLAIQQPAENTAFNIGGTGGRIADLTPGNATCEAAFDVFCSEVGRDVTLVREDTATTLGSAPCVAQAGLPAPYLGRATFASVSLPSVNSGASFNVVARQSIDRLNGQSSPISLRSDCVAPALSITRPVCGSRLNPSTQDENTATPQFEYRTVVQNSGDPEADVTLTIRPQGGGAPISTVTNTATASTVVFPSANYGSGGQLEVVATATDNAGNPGQAVCAVIVENLPTLTIAEPANGAVLTTSADCSANPGLQIRVRATTDAPAGSSGTLSVAGTATPATVAEGALEVCVDAPEGRNIAIGASVTDARGTAVTSIQVTVDTQAPTQPISDLAAAVIDRRGGRVRFTWTAVPDAGGTPLSSYALRCARAAITDETTWAAATPVVVMVVPGTAGAVQTEDLGGFRAGETRFCTLRGVDPAGALTPIGGGAEVTVTFSSQEITAPGSVRLGFRVVGVGDVNGDTIADVLIGGNGFAYLYFGSRTGLGSSPAVTITGPNGVLFGNRLAGIGDFNGDGRPDFAIGAHTLATNKGGAFVFFGRPSTTTWPISIDVSGPTCAADLCITSDDGAAGGPDESAFLGFGLGPAGDFDGDGLMDLAIGASGALSNAGRAYILKGRIDFTAGSTIAVPGAPGSEPQGFVLTGDATYRSLGNDMHSIGGDLDGDSRGDLLIGSPGTGRAAYLPGRPYVGPGLQTIANAALSPLGSGGPNTYGNRVIALGDVNGDSRLDAGVVDVGQAGSLAVFLGAGGTLPATPSFTITNDISGGNMDRFAHEAGHAVHPWLRRVGDVDNNGVTDLLLASVETGLVPGSVDLHYRLNGQTGNVVRSQFDVRFGPYTGETRAAYIGDVNGDGFPDIAIGDSTFGGNAGRVIVQY